MATGLNLASLTLFAFASAITPGPNNLLVMRSGARFGLKLSGPHIVGIEAGLAGLIVLAHLGVGALLLASPAVFGLLRWACFGYLLWLAWRVLRDEGGARGPEVATARPWSLGAAAAFQLVNPKAWMMAVTGITAFSTDGAMDLPALATVIGCFVLVGTPCVFVWALWGTAIHRLLREPGARRTFNIVMAAGVAASALLMLDLE